MRSSPSYLMMTSLVAVVFMTLKVHGFATFPLVRVQRHRNSDTNPKGDARSTLRRDKGDRTAYTQCYTASILHLETTDSPDNGKPSNCLSAHADKLAKDYFEPVIASKRAKGDGTDVLVDMSCATGLFTRRFAKSGVIGRRFALLLISISAVNFIRSNILKMPQSTTGMFDECPWPFTLAHDPQRFFKTGATYVTILWAILCWTYGRFGTAFLAVVRQKLLK
ncbi:hypothetical protein THAOC_37152 [Thalassiosira oceanica]|uniref:Uncharacterized protein n=1 Tax=Thalassiosira oceanica TaxID=159749 RepID=K0RCT5_THAOC|nr:hypothetical protein THAOC_37152 [Thalassiosira oceanica]|eukprot:EJK44317.1 hypothetical protein THAOC_37152 [Thalassiosira oceanica]